MAYGTTLNGIRGAGGIPNLVTTLYTGTGAARDIVTGQNLAGGSLVWLKGRSYVEDNTLFDTERGATQRLISNDTSAQSTQSQSVTAFNSSGFSLGTDADQNTNTESYVAWSFLQKAGFMDIVAYNGSSGVQAISHNLGAVPAFIIIKRLTGSSVADWQCYHKDLNGGTNPEDYEIKLNLTSGENLSTTIWDSTAPTNSEFTVGLASDVNTASSNYIAYLFAHNPAQKIYCGSFTTDGSGNATVTGLGFRPKWLMVKRTSSTGNWEIADIERGWGVGDDATVDANTSGVEATGNNIGAPTSDGFTYNKSTATYIFMAIG